MFEVENNLVTMSPRDLDEVDLQPRPIEDQTIAQIITDTINSISDDWDPNSTTKFRFLANTGDIEIKNHLSHQVFPTDAVDQEKLVAKLCGYLYEPRGQDHFSTRFHNHKEAGQHNDIEHSPTPSQRPQPRPNTKPQGTIGNEDTTEQIVIAGFSANGYETDLTPTFALPSHRIHGHIKSN